MDNDYSPAKSVATLSPLPLLLLHGAQDNVVPPHHSQQLLARASEPKVHWLIPDAGHTQSLRDEATRRKLVEFMLRHSG